MTDGIERLRAKRGDQEVRFWQVADHLNDYVDRHPDDAEAVRRLGAFLADVEDVPHRHEDRPTRGLG